MSNKTFQTGETGSNDHQKNNQKRDDGVNNGANKNNQSGNSEKRSDAEKNKSNKTH